MGPAPRRDRSFGAWWCAMSHRRLDLSGGIDLTEALSWLDPHLAAAGIACTAEPARARVRPWSTVIEVPTDRGPVWIKAGAPGMDFEAALYALLVRVVPGHVLAPIAIDPIRRRVALPDGGPALRDRLDGAELAAALAAPLAAYGDLQLALAPHVGAMLQLGVPDMRPARMAERLEEALDLVGANLGPTSEAERRMLRDVAARRPTIVRWCDELSASSLAASLDHNDLHPGNILGDAKTPRFYDWGDSVVAHPFAAMVVPLRCIRDLLAGDVADPRYSYARDAYLEGFTHLAPRSELRETLELACRVGKIARALTWHRAIPAALDAGETVDRKWRSAPLRWLESLLDESYLGPP
jgi:hypothetical protein